MSLLADVLTANAAVGSGTDVPVPALPESCRVVIVTCSEIRCPGGRDLATLFGLTPEDTFVIANAGARVEEPDGDVVRSVGAAISWSGTGEVFVVAHENCAFLQADAEALAAILPTSYSAAIANVEALCGESFVSARKLVVTSARALRASPYLPRGVPVHAMLLADGRDRISCEEEGYAQSALARGEATSPLAPRSPVLAPSVGDSLSGPFAATGPVSLMGAGPSPLMGAGPPTMGAPPPALASPGPTFATPGAASLLVSGPARPPVDIPLPPPSTSPPVSFGSSPPPPAPRPQSPPPPQISFAEPEAEPAPEPPPAPERKSSSAADDPFRRANEVLERLRRERKNK